MTRKQRHYPNRTQALAAAQTIATQNRTCDGCAALRKFPRPMCRSEASPHFRTARDTYHPRCGAYNVTRVEVAMPEPEPISRFAIAGKATKGRR